MLPSPLTPIEEAEIARRKREARSEAALRGWQGRRSKRNQYHAWLLEKVE